MLRKYRAFLRVFLFCFITLAVFALIFGFTAKRLERTSEPSLPFVQGWHISINGKTFAPQNLQEFSFAFVKKGDTIILQNTLPSLRGNFTVLRWYSAFCAIEVTIDGVLAYNYGEDLRRANKNLGKGLHTVNLPKTSAHKPIQIVLKVTENNAFNALQAFYIEPAELSFVSFIASKAFSLIMAIFCMGLGVYGTFAFFVLQGFHLSIFRRLFLIAQGSFWLGIATLFNNGTVIQFSTNYSFNAFFEYVSLYCANIFMLALYLEAFAKTKHQKITFATLSIMCIALFAIGVLLDRLNLVHLNATLPFFCCIAFAELVAVIIFAVPTLKSANAFEEKLPTIGLIVFLFLIIFDFITYTIFHFNSFLGVFTSGSFGAIGMIVLICTIVVAYFIKLPKETQKNYLAQKKEQARYIDYVTGLYNSDYCAMSLDALASDDYKALDEKNAAVIAIQLYCVSDDTPQFGTLEGNDFLARFSGYLEGIFSSYGDVCLLKAGQFCVVAKNLTEEKVQRFERRLKDLLFAEMQHSPRMQYALFFGYAMRSETSDPQKMYQLAEQRMKEKSLERH